MPIKQLGTIHEPVQFVVPGGEGKAPEQEVTPTEPMPREEVGLPPILMILGAAALVIGGVYGLNRLLK